MTETNYSLEKIRSLAAHLYQQTGGLYSLFKSMNLILDFLIQISSLSKEKKIRIAKQLEKIRIVIQEFNHARIDNDRRTMTIKLSEFEQLLNHLEVIFTEQDNNVKLLFDNLGLTRSLHFEALEFYFANRGADYVYNSIYPSQEYEKLIDTTLGAIDGFIFNLKN